MPFLRRSWFGRLAAAAVLLLAAACSRSGPAADPVIRLVENAEDPAASYVEVAGVDRDVRNKARGLNPTSGEWGNILEVHVRHADRSASGTAVAGTYRVVGDVIRFTPLFPFDPGRQYDVRYSRLPVRSGADASTIRTTVARRAGPAAAPTHVTDVFPSGPTVPENQLRMYVHFSASMGRRGGLDHVKLFDEKGREVVDPFLPLDAEFWNADRTRYTVFFDPGRQKRGILPHREMGPSLVAGRGYRLVIDRQWIDGNGNPLRETFTRQFRVRTPDLHPLDYKGWRVTPPAQGTRDPLTVEFPAPLDHGLLLRAIGVRRDGKPIVGEARVDRAETRWTMTPADAWTPGRYELIALSILEDLAGNRIGQAFEVEAFNRADQQAGPETTSIPFNLATPH